MVWNTYVLGQHQVILRSKLKKILSLLSNLPGLFRAKFNMAAPYGLFGGSGHLVAYFTVYFIMVSTLNNSQSNDIETITLKDVEEITKKSCVLTCILPTKDFNKCGVAFGKLQAAFKYEPKVRFAVVRNEEKLLKAISQKNGYVQNFTNNTIIFFPRQKLDRTCLTPKPKFVLKPEVVPIVEGKSNAQLLLMFLNSKCQTFHTLDGELSMQGRKRLNLLKNLYHLPKTPAFPIIGTFCERIKLLSKQEFIEKFLYRSRPVIIEGALGDWPALKKWTNQFLLDKFGKNEVHIKLTSDGIFEGCERAELFSNFKTFHIPDYVAKQLPFRDLVVVRPATMNLNFSSFMDMVKLPKAANISAYLEYSSIPDYMPELQEDVEEFSFVKDILTKRHLNLWLSNGNTLGKLHFDPFDNFLCQISGTKQITLFEPHDNTLLYEGHIQEAVLSFNKKFKKFSRKTLLDSTSMVMSPIDILRPDYERFPKFRKVPAMSCTIHPGDVLYMPSFWWHEVKSTSGQEKRNLAVNFWYEPFLTKDFPCAECPVDVNSHYHHALL